MSAGREKHLRANRLVTVPVPVATAEIIAGRLGPMVRDECARVNAYVPLRELLDRVALNAYLQGGVDTYGILVGKKDG